MKEKEATSFTGGEWKNDNNGEKAFSFSLFFKGMQPPSVRHSRLKATGRAEVFAFLAIYIEKFRAQPVAVKKFYNKKMCDYPFMRID